MLKRLRAWFFVRHPNKNYPEFVRTLRSHLDMNHLSEFDFLGEIFHYSVRNYYSLEERDVDGFTVLDIPHLSTDDIKVSVVITNKGTYEEHMHANSEACLMTMIGKGHIVLNGEKRSLSSFLGILKAFHVLKGMYHGFEVRSERMVFVSIQCPPILDHGIEDIHFRDKSLPAAC